MSAHPCQAPPGEGVEHHRLDFTLAVYDRRLLAAFFPMLRVHVPRQAINVNLSENVLFIQPKIFREQMEYLRVNNYQVISYAQFYDAFINGTKLPDKPVVLTFDDGNKDLFNNAYPILREYNYPAMFFVYTKSIGHFWGGTMNWAMLREMSQHGMEIGSHTVNHSKLTELDFEQVKYELVESKKVLENNLFITINHLAYPYGLFNTATEQAVRAAGYLSAAAVVGGSVHDRVHGPYQFERVIATEDMGYFKWILDY